jgi:Fic family protein
MPSLFLLNLKKKSKKKVWNPEEPYNNLPLLPPESDLETRAVLKACVKSRAALAELKQAANLIPNQKMLINNLPLLEAQASSEIENIVTTSNQMFRYCKMSDKADFATKEALRYHTALFEGYRVLNSRPISTAAAVVICSTINQKEMNVRKEPGTQVYNSSQGRVIYTPPTGEDTIRILLLNWEDFLHKYNELDPLIKMAVAHYQFEAIHPFEDGNGRTGRIINSLFLVHEGLLSLPILHLSRYIIRNRAEYYRLLLGVTEGELWEDWILYILRGVEETAVWTTNKVAAIHELEKHTTDYVRDKCPKIYSHELIDVIFEQPYCRISNLIEKNIVKRQAASEYLKTLCEIGVLAEKATGREKIFIHPKLLEILTCEPNDFTPYEY